MAQTIIPESAASLNVNPIAPTGPVLKMVNGRPVVSSLEVAKHFGKRHDNLIRSIQAIIRNSPESFAALNFEASEYTDSTGRKLIFYYLTRDGFVIVAMGFTGKKAIEWKITYIMAFNAMEAQGMGIITGTLTPSQQQEIKELVQAKASAYPDAMKRKVFSQIWARIQRKFKVPRYEELPAVLFGEARDYVIAMQIRGAEPEALPAAESPKALPEATPTPTGSIRDYAWFYRSLPDSPDVWRRLSFKAADAFERFGKEIDAIKLEAFRPFLENRKSGATTFFDEAMSPNHALFKIADDQMRVAYRCIYESLDGLKNSWSLLRRG